MTISALFMNPGETRSGSQSAALALQRILSIVFTYCHDVAIALLLRGRRAIRTPEVSQPPMQKPGISKSRRIPTSRAAALALTLLWYPAAAQAQCPGHIAGSKNLYWGDLHVHTAFSMDAYAFGNRRDPGDAFDYARGQSLLLEDGKTLSTIDRPLDFMAVTDHAETFDVMNLCGDPHYLDNEYCADFRSKSTKATGRDVFTRFLLTVITPTPPQRPSLCEQAGIDCNAAARQQWRRSQEFANAADNPCEFTAFIGNEWSATPNNRHWHRNLIFASDSVTREALDYVSYPDVGKLWSAIDEQCLPENGCEVLTIPHNTNLSESGNFSIETDSDRRRQQRIRYERLVEIHQSKGNSECLPEHWDDTGADCGFERVLPRPADKHLAEESMTAETWRQLRAAYARHLLSRGLEAYRLNEQVPGNPLQLGFIGSTDVHSTTPGNTAEDNWKGDAWSSPGDPASRFNRLNYNPGGLVAVWAEQNTRADIFRALKDRRVYGTSGTRIGLRFMAGNFPEGACRGPLPEQPEAEMGGTLAKGRSGPAQFLVLANMDHTPLARVDIVRGRVVNGRAEEQVQTVFEDSAGRSEICVSWRDEQVTPETPAYWYARVLEKPAPRWSRLDCRKQNNCDDHPGADRMIQERAWSSPIWNLP
jgi:hypothetical protein